MNESLTNALHSATFLRDELREANAKGTAVESIVLLLLIENATHARNLIEQLINARAADAVKVPDDLPDVETKCQTCIHDLRSFNPCRPCINEFSETGNLPNWEPKP